MSWAGKCLSVNYFTIERYNGAVISSNISLDLLLSSIYLVYLIKNHLLEKMKIEMKY